MSAVDVAPDASFGLRAEQGGPPARPDDVTDGGAAIWGAAFRQSNSVISALQYMRNSGSFAPVPDYNPVNEIKGWGDPKYFLQHGSSFVGSQSPAETLSIKSQIDQEETDRKTLAAGGKIGFVAQMGAGLLDPTLLLPGGVGVDAVRGGLSFRQAAIEMGKAGLMQTVSQEALLHASQDTRTFEESAINVASGTMLTALLGGAAASYLGRSERIKLERQLFADRDQMNAHAANPPSPEIIAYHGSPHEFDKFDISKIGTGEGAQSYGHGLYFAQNESVAKGYRDMADATVDGQKYNLYNPLHVAAVQVEESGSRAAAIKDTEARLTTDPDPEGFLGSVLHFLKRDQALPEVKSTGSIYKVRIKANEEHMLDLDKSLDQQTQYVQDAVKRAMGIDYHGNFDQAKADRVWEQFHGADAKTAVRQGFIASDDATVTKRLSDAGIPGSKYFDSDSRKAREGTRNFVVFNHDSVDITHKNGETLIGPEKQQVFEQAMGTGQAMAAGAAASDTRKLELVPFGLSEIPGVRRVVEKTSPMQRVFGSDSVSARRAGADLAETSLLFKENLEGGVTTAGPALDREARLMIHQGQVATGDELSRLYSEYRFGEQKTAPRAQGFLRDMLGQNPEGKMSYDQFKESVSDALRNGDTHEIPQVQMAAQTIRNKVFEPWKERAINAGLLPEDVGVKTADSYLSRLYNKQAIGAKRPEFVNRVTDWLQADQQAKAESQQKIGLYQGALESHRSTIDKLEGRIDKLEKDADVIAARQEETTRVNKAANRRSEQLRESQYRNEGGIRVDVPGKGIENARGGSLFETLARNRGNLLADRASAKLAEVEKLKGHLAEEIQSHDLMRAKIEKELGAWEGKSSKEAKAALKARAEAEKAREVKKAEGTYKGKDERLSAADKAVDSAVRRILESDRDLTRDELRSRAHEITDRIIGSPDGRLPYDLGMEHGTAHGGSGEQPRGALAAREFNIPDATIKDFLENDIEQVIATHLKTMVPDVLLTEKFGDTRMTESFRKINDEYAALSDAAKSDKERTRLEKEKQGVIDDLSAIRDRIRGTYGISPDLPMRNAARVMNVVKNYNVLTSMGSAALSSLPDMAGTVMRHGLVNTFNDAWAPFFNMLTKQSDVWQEAGRQYRSMGIAVESVLASRHHALTDTLDTYHPQSRVERTMQWATGKFQFVNMLAPWTDFAKINASLVGGSEILRATKAAAGGTATSRMMRTLGESGIEPHMAERIAKAFETGGEIRDGVHLPNTAEWTDKEARRVFEGAVARDADIAVVTPGQEKPLWMSHPILSVIGQFKSFTAAATERILISNLQRRDAQVLQGMIFSMGLGMLSYKINSLTGGQPVSDKPQDWIKESISRGNLLGWFEEGNALASKASGGGVDIYRLIGAEKPLSRYASRTASDQLLGPTKGKIDSILSAARAASHPAEWNEADSKAIRRLVAGQNVFYIRRLFDQVEAAGNNSFGIEMKAKPENR